MVLLAYPMLAWASKALAAERGGGTVEEQDLRAAIRAIDRTVGQLATQSLPRKQAKACDFVMLDTDVVVAAIVSEFGDRLDVTRPLSFDGAGSDAHAAYTHPIKSDVLGDNIDIPRYRDRVSDFLGGVLVVIEDIDPPVTVADVEKRLSRMRSQPDFVSALGRDVGVFGLESAVSGDPAAGYRSVAVSRQPSDISRQLSAFSLRTTPP